MARSFVIGSVVGAIAVTAGGAAAGYHYVSAGRSAEVLAVHAEYRTVRTPRKDCHTVEVTRVRPAKDTHRAVGAGVGAVVGGLLGSQFGGGNGRVLATLAGAAAGGYAGHRVERSVQESQTYTTQEQRCSTVYDSSRVPAGYDVLYQLHGERHHVHMSYDPGQRLAVRDGQVVTDQAD